MRGKLLNQHAGERVYAVVLDTGEDPIAELTRFAEAHNLTGARETGLSLIRF